MRRVTTSKVTKPKGVRPAALKGGTSLDVGRRVLSIEARAVQALVQRLDGGFSEAVDLLYQCKGKVVVSGMGKSGLIGQKVAATMASTMMETCSTIPTAVITESRETDCLER